MSVGLPCSVKVKVNSTSVGCPGEVVSKSWVALRPVSWVEDLRAREVGRMLENAAIRVIRRAAKNISDDSVKVRWLYL